MEPSLAPSPAASAPKVGLWICMGPLPSFSRCFRQLLSLSELHPFIPEYYGCSGSPVGKKAGAPFLSGEGGSGSSQAPSRPSWGGVANSVGGVVYTRMWGWLSRPTVSSDLSLTHLDLKYPLRYPPCPYLHCAPLGKEASMSPSVGMPGLSFALFSIHGPLSGTWWNPQLDSQSSLLSHGAV